MMQRILSCSTFLLGLLEISRLTKVNQLISFYLMIISISLLVGLILLRVYIRKKEKRKKEDE
ncbi:hypothetical protein PFZ81_002525 [Enterococcus hirae]|nr:hypothetical protein [Enterococcus hirae]EMF0233840.1 hypothetical protein [Enterococcus hirae]